MALRFEMSDDGIIMFLGSDYCCWMHVCAYRDALAGATYFVLQDMASLASLYHFTLPQTYGIDNVYEHLAKMLVVNFGNTMQPPWVIDPVRTHWMFVQSLTYGARCAHVIMEWQGNRYTPPAFMDAPPNEVFINAHMQAQFSVLYYMMGKPLPEI